MRSLKRLDGGILLTFGIFVILLLVALAFSRCRSRQRRLWQMSCGKSGRRRLIRYRPTYPLGF